MVHALYRFRYLLLLFAVLSCGALWPYVLKAIKVDNSLTIWFLKNDPALKEYRQFHQKFGNDEVVILVVEDEKTLLTKKHFSSFISMTKALEALPYVQLVAGAGNAAVVRKNLYGSISEPLLTDSSQPQKVKLDVDAMPALKEQLFNSSYTAARFLIYFKNNPHFDNQRSDMIKEVRKTVSTYFPPQQTYYGGVGIIYEGLNALSNADFGFFLGIGYLAMFVLLLWIYRKVLLLMYAISTIAIATYITIGLYGLCGLQLNLMTILIPAILIVLGIMDILHVLNEYSLLAANTASKKEAALAALKSVSAPCLFTTVTTMAGFLSLLISPMAILQQFGLFTALGILFCQVFTYTLGVIFLPISAPSRAIIFSARTIADKILASVLLHKMRYTGISVLILLVSITGLFLIKSDTYTLGYFPENNEIVKDHKKMEELWGPYMPLELVVKPAHGKTLYDTAIIRRAVLFADAAKNLSGAGSVVGFQSFYQAALNAKYRATNSRMYHSSSVLADIHNGLLLYDPAQYAGFVHEESQTGRITLFGKMTSAKQLNRKMDTLLHLGKEAFGQSANISPAGYQPMYAHIVRYVTESQTKSLFLSCITIFLLVLLFIRHLKLTILATIANLIPVLIMLGMMGCAGIYLDTASASIAAIVLSICMDDTIHFIYHYKQLRLKGHTLIEARQETVSHIGSSILLSSLILIAGYALMIFGSLKTVHLFGLLTVIALVAALYAELVIFPLLLEKFDNAWYKEEG